MSTTLGDAIRAGRQAKGWTQERLADLLDLGGGRAVVSQWEREGCMPRLRTLRRLERLLDVELQSLCADQIEERQMRYSRNLRQFRAPPASPNFACKCHQNYLGHFFGANLRCIRCRAEWSAHQEEPKPCPGPFRGPAADKAREAAGA